MVSRGTQLPSWGAVSSALNFTGLLQSSPLLLATGVLRMSCTPPRSGGLWSPGEWVGETGSGLGMAGTKDTLTSRWPGRGLWPLHYQRHHVLSNEGDRGMWELEMPETKALLGPFLVCLWARHHVSWPKCPWHQMGTIMRL